MVLTLKEYVWAGAATSANATACSKSRTPSFPVGSLLFGNRDWREKTFVYMARYYRLRKVYINEVL